MNGRGLRRACASCATAAWFALLLAPARAQQMAGPQLPPVPMAPGTGPVVTAPLNAGPGYTPSFADSLPPEASGPLSSADAEASLKQFLRANVAPVDLMTAFRLVGEQNPQVLIAQSRVIEALALRQLAAAQFLPTLNAGTSLNSHRGTLQQSNGSILQVNRDSLYAGAGAFAVGGGTVNIPGVVLTGNVAVMTYDYLVARQEVERRRFVEDTVTQDTLLAAATGYIELLRAEELQKVAEQTRDDAREVARLTANYAQTGEGRKADADRAATELYRREALVIQTSSDIGTASAQLARVLHLGPLTRLHPVDEHVLPKSIVPEPITLPELIAIALMNRPELSERRVAICQALLRLEQQHWLPFSPTIFLGLSAGTFGGGSSLVNQPVGSGPDALGDPRFGLFDPRVDFDAAAYWTVLNLGVGNKALIDAARSRLRSANLEQVVVLDRIRAEVAAAYARTHARYAQIAVSEMAIQSSLEGFQEDMRRIIAHEGLPLELINSLRLLGRARTQYTNAILDYNRAQFELYVAIGKPPADVLIRPVSGSPAVPVDLPSTPPAPLPPPAPGVFNLQSGPPRS
jgi:outer membrane protein TolC